MRTDLRRLPPGAREDWSHLPAASASHAARLDPADRAALEAVLREDVISEYDARFLSRFLAEQGLDYTPGFQAAERRWAVDEERHYLGTASVFDAHFGVDLALAERVPDFSPLTELFSSELGILVLFCYDELATVGAYKANLPLYAKLGPEYLRWARALVADEAWHYAAFLRVLLNEHAGRLEEALPLVERVRALEVPYAATFVLDHDDQVFTGSLLDRAQSVLRRRIVEALQREEPAARKRA